VIAAFSKSPAGGVELQKAAITRRTPKVATVTSEVEKREHAILDVLRRGGAYTVAEIAASAGLTVRSVSQHLRLLKEAGQVAQASQYRYRFFRLSSPEPLERSTECQRRAADLPRDIRFARSCYGHLAGWLGVRVTRALVERNLVEPTGDVFKLIAKGETWLDGHSIALPEKRVSPRRFARPCLDWTEKQPHLAGALGQTLLSHYVAQGWLERWPAERTLTLTPAGETALETELGISLR
jgi:DNA-binding transcriptional ArsR family regulator